jgi:hypothetical protein
VLLVLNFCIAACGGVFLLSLFGRTDLVTSVPQPIAAVQPESHQHAARTFRGVSERTKNGGRRA